jgi:hypothetical protein
LRHLETTIYPRNVSTNNKLIATANIESDKKKAKADFIHFLASFSSPRRNFSSTAGDELFSRKKSIFVPKKNRVDID